MPSPNILDSTFSKSKFKVLRCFDNTDKGTNSLPDIIRRVQQRLDEVTRELSQFRAKDTVPLVTILDVLGVISTSIREQLTHRASEFRPGYEGLKTQFRKTLQESIPEFDASSPEHKTRICIDIDDSEEEPEPSPTPTPAPRSSNKRRAPVPPSSSNNSKRLKTETMPTVSHRVRFTIADVNHYRNKYASDMLPGQPSPEVTDVIIKESMTGWTAVLEDVLDKVDEQLQDMLSNVLREKLARFERCELHQRTSDVALAHMQALLAHQKQEARKLLAREMHKPMTTSPLEAHRQAMINELTKKRNIKRLEESWDKAEANGGKVLTAETKAKQRSDENLAERLSYDQHKQAVEAMALPLAYYKVASGRFVDSVALLIELDLLDAFQRDIKDVLIQGIGPLDAATCDRLLLEDAAQEQRRRALLKEQTDLKTAMAKLDELRNADADADV